MKTVKANKKGREVREVKSKNSISLRVFLHRMPYGSALRGE